MTQLDIQYVRVSALGVPTHAVVNMTLKEEPSILKLTNPTSGGRPGRARHVMIADETLQSVATKTFGTPGAWRAIAEINGIDDPASLRPGDVIYLPAREELRPLAKVVSGDAALANAKACIQVHGGIGYTWELDVQRYWKRAVVLDTHFGNADRWAEAVAATI